MLNTEKDIKSAVTNLRRALRAHYGTKVPSHTQCLEMMAQALGASSYAQLRTRFTEAQPAVQPAQAPAAEVAVAPTAKASERLLNDKGQFDLVKPGEEGEVVHGLSFEEVEGTVEDIEYCVALATSGRRDGTQLAPEYEGETDVNWDGQRTRTDSHGNNFWHLAGGTHAVSSTELILVPEGFVPEEDPDEQGNWPWPVRENLVAAYADYARRHRLVQALLHGQSGFWDPEDDTLVQVAEALGFALHYGELEKLLEALKAIRDSASK